MAFIVAACGIWPPEQGSNLGPLHWECGVLAKGTTREFPSLSLFLPISSLPPLRVLFFLVWVLYLSLLISWPSASFSASAALSPSSPPVSPACCDSVALSLVPVLESLGSLNAVGRWVRLRKAGAGGVLSREEAAADLLPTYFPTVEYPLTLQCANISILEPRLCRRAYPGHISDSMLCAGLWEGGRGSCQVRPALGRTGVGVLQQLRGPGGEGSWSPRLPRTEHGRIWDTWVLGRGGEPVLPGFLDLKEEGTRGWTLCPGRRGVRIHDARS